MRDHIQPVAATIVPGKRVFWHTMRRTYASLLQAHNEDPTIVQDRLRPASFAVSMNIYAQAASEKKRKAQTKVIGIVVASQNVAKSKPAIGSELAVEGSQ